MVKGIPVNPTLCAVIGNTASISNGRSTTKSRFDMTALLRLIFSHFRGRKGMDFLDMDVATRIITIMGAAYNGHTQVWLRLPICITSSTSVTLYPSDLYSGSGLSFENALSSVFWY